MKENYTISLKLGLFLISLVLLHTVAGILSGLGLVSDLFIVIGAYSVWQNVKTKDARQTIIDKVNDVIDIDDIGELLSKKTETLRSQLSKLEDNEFDFYVEKENNKDNFLEQKGSGI